MSNTQTKLHTCSMLVTHKLVVSMLLAATRLMIAECQPANILIVRPQPAVTSKQLSVCNQTVTTFQLNYDQPAIKRQPPFN